MWSQVEHNRLRQEFFAPERQADFIFKMPTYDCTYSVWWEEQIVQQQHSNTDIPEVFGLVRKDNKWGLTVISKTWYSQTFNKEIETWLRKQIEKELFDG